MIHKWYRGHDGKQKATDNFGIIWLADNPEYAKLYADEYGDEGVVSVFYIDENKLNCADTYYNDNFDVYDPDMREVKEYQKEGYNCYTFPVDMGDTDVLALFDESAIVKIEQLNTINENKMKNTIKLTESELKGIIIESVRRVVGTLSEKKEDHSYKPIGPQTFYTNNGKIEHKSIVTLQSPSGQVCHIAEDDHCYVLFNGSGIDCGGNGLNDKNCEMIHYIFPEAFKALKELPLL